MGLFDNLNYSFNANEPTSYPALQRRQAIALAMMAQNRKGYPKNVGEGLTAIGDAIGERSTIGALERSQAVYDKYVRENQGADPATLLDQPAAAGRRSEAAPTGQTVSLDSAPDITDSTPAPVQTADAAPPAQLPPVGVAPGAAAPVAASPLNPAQTSQMASLLGTGGAEPVPAYAPTASADPNAAPVQAPPGVLPPAVAAQRARIAALTAPGVPQPNPTMGAVPAALQSSATPSPSLADPGSQPLDPGRLVSPAEAAGNPPIRLAQAGPAPGIPQINRVTPPVTMPPTGPVGGPPENTPMNAAEVEGLRRKQLGIRLQDPSIQQEGQLLIDAGKEKRLKQDADNMKAWEAQIETERQRRLAQEGREAGAGLSQQQLTKATAEASIAANKKLIGDKTGLDPDTVITDLRTRLTNAGADVSLLKNARVAKTALDNGVFSGLGANLKIDIAKARALFGNLPSSELVSRAEMLAASTQAMVKYGLNQYQPGDPRVTNGDLIVGKAIVGGTPSQQLETQKSLVNMVLQDANNRIGEYERIHHLSVGGLPAEDIFRLRTDPIHPDPAKATAAINILLDPNNINDPYARQKFDERFGPGSADLEIARAERKARRGR